MKVCIVVRRSLRLNFSDFSLEIESAITKSCELQLFALIESLLV